LLVTEGFKVLYIHRDIGSDCHCLAKLVGHDNMCSLSAHCDVHFQEDYTITNHNSSNAANTLFLPNIHGVPEICPQSKKSIFDISNFMIQ